MSEFKSFDKILNINKVKMTITQKLHGSNAQVYIYRNENGELDLKTGSRNRWVQIGDDNYGFARFVQDQKQAFIECLGEGRHFGEWVGKGINSGEGLPDKRLFLFNHRRWKDQSLPQNVFTVPVLYSGDLCLKAIDDVMQTLKEKGSFLSPGFMKPEGIVIEIGDNLFKKTFENEETNWQEADKQKNKIPREHVDVLHLLQPIRLEKLLSRDSQYLEKYPHSLNTICADYVKDLEEENQIQGNQNEIKSIKKGLGRVIFSFVKTIVENRREI